LNSIKKSYAKRAVRASNGNAPLPTIRAIALGWMQSTNKLRRNAKVQTVIVTHADTSKNGKPRVFFDGNNTWKDAYYLGPKCPDPPKGVPIEIESHSWRPENGKSDLWFLDSFKVVAQAPQSIPEPTQTTYVPRSVVSGGLVPSAPIAAPAAYTEPERMFVSNIVAAAVTAGHATDPVDLLAWAAGALQALRGMVQESTVDRDVGF
jgi:hypothetical protein